MDDKNKDMNEDQLPDFFKENKGGFNVPENYFNDFQSRLFSQLNQEDELKSFALLSSIKRVSPFAVPDNYFENQKALLSEKVESLAENLNYSFLNEFKKSAFVIPDEYFTSKIANIQSRIEFAKEIKEFSTLNSIDKINCFDVPQFYFEDLRVAVQSRLTQKSPNGWWIKLSQILFQKKLAYAFGIVVVFGMLFILNNSEKNSMNANAPCNELACLEKNEIIKSNFIQNLDEESLMEFIDEKNFNDSTLNDKNVNAELLDEVDAATIMNEL